MELLPGGVSAVLHLGLTKSGRRKGRPETVVVDDQQVVQLVTWAADGKRPGDGVLGRKNQVFRKDFKRLLERTGLAGLEYMPYSLRRGGASHLFRETGNLSLVQERGRWGQASTARIYVDEAVALSKTMCLEDWRRKKCDGLLNVLVETLD